MKIIKFIFLIFPLISFSANSAENEHIFSPAPGVKAAVKTNGATLTWEVDGGGKINRHAVNIDTEKSTHIDIDDYDFSGHLGFAVWHVDDGLGVYSIYRIFTFSPLSNKFVERYPAPRCGDEFINLKIDKKRRRLLSTIWDQSVPKVCATRLVRLKQ
ncbi:hypothetical protein [Paraburkholderia kururiensis]|uniref:Uncharacterized protein n=1 Tax=Paraburkholderia kururiensis TaxID=984307 RepID=A0ABZ0WP25_9BURK|nr:hypothetical protein [Paraburkholderia kururiensis]WQD79112.1 hypothetical protein U0042_05250 [Paraburkholderia kururiensis]